MRLHLSCVLLATALGSCASPGIRPDPNPDAPVFEESRHLDLDGASALETDLMDPGGEDGAFCVELRVCGEMTEEGSTVFGCKHFGGFGLTWSHPELAPNRPTAWLNTSHVPGTRTKGYVLARSARSWQYDEWTHVAVTFDGRFLRLFADGVLVAESFTRGKRRRSNKVLVLGADATGKGVGGFFTGQLDDVRVSDIARYTEDFTPPAFVEADENTLLLLDFEDEDAPFADRSWHESRVEPVGDQLVR